MSSFGKLLHLALALGLVLGLTSASQANVWIDEDFENVTSFTQGNGSAASGTVDPFDGDVLATLTGTLLTRTGTRVTNKAFEGTGSYRLNASQSVVVADGYDGQPHGDWIYFQYAINVDPIPATAGNIATWTYTNTINSVVHTFNVSIDADGAGNAVVSTTALAGASPLPPNGGISTIATLTNASQWKLLTIQLGVSGTPQADPRDRTQPPPRAAGAYFYATDLVPTSAPPSVTIPFTGGASKDGNGWSLTVNGATSASLYIDNLYWEGAREDPNSPAAGQSNQYLQPFNAVTSVNDWMMY